uniref:Uncharacterized protein n=1 Tax=Hyaloperonospora arabidopsidis (strain Emoy2) TaxID=559515 RepID=M4C0U7_HYAAE
MRGSRRVEDSKFDLFECRNCGSSRKHYRLWCRKSFVDATQNARARNLLLIHLAPKMFLVRRAMEQQQLDSSLDQSLAPSNVFLF